MKKTQRKQLNLCIKTRHEIRILPRTCQIAGRFAKVGRVQEDSPKEVEGEAETPRMGDGLGWGHPVSSQWCHLSQEAHCPSAGIPKSAAECGGLKTAQDGQRLVPGADPVLRTDPLRSEVSATGTGTAFQTCLSPPAYRDSSHAALSPSSVPTL